LLKLINIKKDYHVGNMTVNALRGVSLNFRENEFVSILGPSGCGKTTMLNIIGGLDQYTSGELYINNRPTSSYNSRDWDTYRNHSVGFVFQSYNLIPHQTVLANVELSLTLSGISKSERTRRAKEMLERVGLGDQFTKKPNQLSGGQMQRVAIARALINDPEILLADEPSGALDSVTSVQIMNLLKEIAETKLVIMVTHNPELAETYSTRIIKLKDGLITSDSNPYEEKSIVEAAVGKIKHVSMSFFTALALSFKNLLTKKTRTALTSFAGSIGIIGIALILALSTGIQAYIDRVQRDTAAQFPLVISSEQMNFMELMMSMMMAQAAPGGGHLDPNVIHSHDVGLDLMNQITNLTHQNNLREFMQFIEGGGRDGIGNIRNYAQAIQFSYNLQLPIFINNNHGDPLRINPINPMEMFGMPPMVGLDFWVELLEGLNGETLNPLIEEQYNLIGGRSSWPSAKNELVLFVDQHNRLPDLVLFAIGLRDMAEFNAMREAHDRGEEFEITPFSLTFDEIIGTSFRLIMPSDFFEYDTDTGLWVDRSDDDAFVAALMENAMELTIVGIARPDPDATGAIYQPGVIGHTAELSRYIIDRVNSSAVVAAQMATPEIDIFTGISFEAQRNREPITMEEIMAFISTLPEVEQGTILAMIEHMPEEQVFAMFYQHLRGTTDASFESNLELIGYIDLGSPSAISILPRGFDEKEAISAIIARYNAYEIAAGREENEIVYSDFMGALMSSMSTIINFVAYGLIAFVSVSLVVSSIMIGIITYISVLERTKEIGILRAIGASKKDISRVFNAETLIVGFSAGLLGILATLALILPMNLILGLLTDVSNIAILQPAAAIILILISMFLTFMAGLIPSRIAAKKDPVVALRTE